MPDPHTNGQGDWRDIVVSIVPNAWETKTTDISLGAALENIRSGRWAKPVASIREKYAEALAEAEKDGNTDPHKAAKDAVGAPQKGASRGYVQRPIQGPRRQRTRCAFRAYLRRY